MTIPSSLLVKVLQFVIKSSQTAFRGNTLLEKVATKKIGEYLIEITYRGYKGADDAISQVVRVFKNGRVQEIWHMVVKTGKIIHKHLLK